MKKINSLVLSTITAAFLVGCGGGGGGSSNETSSNETSSTSTVGGTVAIGAGISAQIEIMDAGTCEVMRTTSDSEGNWSYSGNLSTYQGPFIIKASSSVGFNMYSYLDPSENRVANITPFTHYASDNASRAATTNSIAALYASCDASTGGLANTMSDFETNLTSTVNSLLTLLGTTFVENQFANANPFTIPFTANQTGYDALLDRVDMSLNNNDTVIRLGNTTLGTLGSDVNYTSTQDINTRVVDSSENTLEGVTVSIDTRNSLIDFEPIVATFEEGAYTANVPRYRDYVITYSKDGYGTTTQNYRAFVGSSIEDNIVTMFRNDELNTTVTPTLKIINSRTGDDIFDVNINIREGFNNRLGEIDQTLNSSEDLSLAPGIYTFELSKAGHETRYQTVTISSSTSSLNFDLISLNNTTTPTINSNAFATIIVRWGENPSDIDSHLIFTKSTNTESELKSRVYYGNQSVGARPTDVDNPCATSGVIASLDLDDTTSYGPETTTICDGTNAPFEFKLHHFYGSSNIGASPTTVELITRDGSRYEFTAPTTGFNGQSEDDMSGGDVWNVFTLGANQTVETVNTISTYSETIGSHDYDESDYNHWEEDYNDSFISNRVIQTADTIYEFGPRGDYTERAVGNSYTCEGTWSSNGTTVTGTCHGDSSLIDTTILFPDTTPEINEIITINGTEESVITGVYEY